MLSLSRPRAERCIVFAILIHSARGQRVMPRHCQRKEERERTQNCTRGTGRVCSALDRRSRSCTSPLCTPVQPQEKAVSPDDIHPCLGSDMRFS